MKNINNIINIKNKKLYYLKKLKFNYPNKFINKPICEIKNLKKYIITSGRIISKRNMGKTKFYTIQDNLCKIQLYINFFILEKKDYIKLKFIDTGDIILAKGILFKTKTNELSIKCSNIILLSKCTKCIPDNFYGLKNNQIRYRQRYIDLISNNTIKIFMKRSNIINYIRHYMKKKKFIEVETPILHKIIGGAAAKPFITYYNFLKKKMYLRISPELYLKKLIVGGFNKVFEINKNFRNESISNIHSPEFTMMELYAAYTNYLWQIKFLEKLIKKIIKFTNINSNIIYLKKLLNFKKLFTKLTIEEAILKYIPEYSINNINCKLFLLKLLKKNFNKKFKIKKFINILQYNIFEEKIAKNIWNPTFIIKYPKEISPLAKSNKNFAERFEFFIAGKEIANAFSELNDPIKQKKNFIKQINLKININQNKINKSYIKALKYGMPPASGCGIGIDRLIMILTNKKNIKDVILFPYLKIIKNKN